MRPIHRRFCIAAGVALFVGAFGTASVCADILPITRPDSVEGNSGSAAVVEPVLKAEFSLRGVLPAASQTTVPVYQTGEPITLDHRLTNVGGRYAYLWVGYFSDAWFHLTVEDSHGKPVPENADGKPRIPAGVSAGPSGRLAPLQSCAGEANLTARYTLTTPGRYVVRIKVEAPYLDLGAATNPPPNEAERLQSSPLRIRKEYVLPFELVQGDPDALIQRASTLRRRFALEPDVTRRASLAKELFGLPEAVALRQWRSLAFDPAADRIIVARELAGRIGTLEAARILVDVEFDAPITDAQKKHFSTLPLLTEILRTRPELNADIQALIARRSKGTTVPMIVD